MHTSTVSGNTQGLDKRIEDILSPFMKLSLSKKNKMFPPAKNCFFPNVHDLEVNRNDSFGDCRCNSIIWPQCQIGLRAFRALEAESHTRAPSANVDATTASISEMRKTRGLEAFDLRLRPPIYFCRYIITLTLACSARTEPGKAETFHL